MRLLGIETSCDETGIAILEKRKGKFRVLANKVSSQIEIHRPYGGVYPSLAKREHLKNLPLVLRKVLNTKYQILNAPDAIAVTVGPGLDPCLWAGIEFAKNLAKQWNVPLIPVNHVEGHLLISLFSQGDEKSEIRPARRSGGNPKSETLFPAIALLVSGGHTQLVLVKQIGQYKILGETRDDAAGECFDKTARILGLSYPGGPAIAAVAAKIRSTRFAKASARRAKSEIRIRLPRPMIHAKDYDFSFSGLKTAVLYDWKSRPEKLRKSKAYIRAMAKEIQQAVIDVLVVKTMRAAQEHGAESIILGGGVAANKELRKQFNSQCAIRNFELRVAPKELCTDNGLMIALAGYFHKPQKRIEAAPDLRLE